MEQIARNYFQQLFTTNGTSASDRLLERVSPCISIESNQMFLKDYITEKILTTLKTMGPTKALGEDGFLAIFFKKYWHIVGNEVSSFCLEILNNGKDITPLNHT